MCIRCDEKAAEDRGESFDLVAAKELEVAGLQKIIDDELMLGAPNHRMIDIVARGIERQKVIIQGMKLDAMSKSEVSQVK